MMHTWNFTGMCAHTLSSGSTTVEEHTFVCVVVCRVPVA